MTEQGYNPKEIEGKWQRIWEKRQVFDASEQSSKPKYYLLEMFPYPSGRLHMGHVRNYTLGDVLNRYKRMKGFNVLHPIGWDAFGLPAENAAIKHDIHPWEWTYNNIAYMRQQLKKMGVGYDLLREFATCDPEYYKWNQWFFIKFLEKGLVYRKKSAVNFCPSCQTVLANEQVEQGRCWRCDSEVVQKELEQWYFKITAYTEELLRGHELLAKGWAERILLMQQNWIGKSEGAEIVFPLEDKRVLITPPHPHLLPPGEKELTVFQQQATGNYQIKVFTTRPDTLCGVTYMVLAPEHPLVEELTKGTSYEAKVREFVGKVAKQNKIVRTAEEIKKEGIFIGVYCKNPVTGARVPIWIANYVLMEYGTGAVMAVPAHDTRDFAFAKEYDLPIIEVISPSGKTVEGQLSEAYVDEGIMVNSGQFDGLNSKAGKEKIVEFLAAKKMGKKVINYRLRDWLISRQRYWGTPIPIVYCEKCGVVPVSEQDLPVLLPENVTFTGKGESPLSYVDDFINTKCPHCGAPGRRETDTMDTFVDSSWYYARYTDAKNNKFSFAKEKAVYWLPVDQYIGGAEHACMHLIYARFFHKVMRDLGLLEGDEPFLRLLNQGMVTLGGTAMSKSKGNIIDPDHIIEKYGADTMRLFILFASPPEKDLEYSEAGIEGAWRFLNRVWRIVDKALAAPISEGDESAQTELHRKVQFAVKKITSDLESEFGFNTAIATLMELVNAMYTLEEKVSINALKEAARTLVMLLSPFTPHIAEELWERLGNKTSLVKVSWPTFDESALIEERVEVVVQINGKVRGRIVVPARSTQDEVQKSALQEEKIKTFLIGKKVLKVIYVPHKLINLVVS